jgi:glycerol-3-phosphate cytidylyltransferase
MKIGFTCSAFDLFHAGHITMLRDAKEHCDFLIVGLQTDPTIDRPKKNRPVQTVYERWVQLAACQYVDRIIPYATEKELLDILQSQAINIRFVGEEYQSQPFTGKDIDGIEIYYNKRRHSFSSTELRQRVFEAKIKQDAQPADSTISYQIDPYGKGGIDWPGLSNYNINLASKSHSDK